MNIHLTDKKCVACEGGVEPLNYEQVQIYKEETPNWFTWFEDMKGKNISCEFECKNFKAALDFINIIGDLAEEEGHHPDITLHAFKKVLITLSTHAIGGLSENDFILAAKIDKIASGLEIKVLPLKATP